MCTCQLLEDLETKLCPAGEKEPRFSFSSRKKNRRSVVFRSMTKCISRTTGKAHSFATFFNALRCFDKDPDRIMNDGSFAMKASNPVVYFITAVVFTLQLTFQIQAVSESTHVVVQLIILKYSREKSWGFPT